MANIPNTQYYFIRKGTSGRGPNDISTGTPGGSQFWTQVTNPNYVAPDTRTTAQKMQDEYTAAYNEAKASNEARYNELLGNLDAQKAEATQLLEGYGTAQKANIADQYKQSLSNSLQNLANTGLYNTTAYGTTQVGNAKAQAQSEQALNESINTQKLNAYNTINAAKNAVIENRTDQYPDMSSYLNLLSQYGYTGADGSTTGYGGTGGYGSSTYGTPSTKVSVTMNTGSGRKYTNTGTALPSGTMYKAGVNKNTGLTGTARTSSFANSRIKDGMTKLKTPTAQSSEKTYSASKLNDLYKKYGSTPSKGTGTVADILNKGTGTLINKASDAYNNIKNNWYYKNLLKKYGNNLINAYSPISSYKSPYYRGA